MPWRNSFRYYRLIRESLHRVLSEFLSARSGGDTTFAGHPLARFIRNDARNTVLNTAKTLYQNPDTLIAKGSAGDVQRWTHTPWIAVMDERETATVQEGIYIVYLVASDCKDAYLTINQGCTTLYQSTQSHKEKTAKAELLRRAAVMQSRLPDLKRLPDQKIDLRPTGWRARLYEAGTVAAVRYQAFNLPSESALKEDLREALIAYDTLIHAGAWTPDDDIIEQAKETHCATSLIEAKNYRQHRKIERAPRNSDKVKRVLGTVCMGCDLKMSDMYGPVAEGYIEAHHLKPLSEYADGEVIKLNPHQDFAVLCPNCHKIIHRMKGVSDINELRKVIRMQQHTHSKQADEIDRKR